MSPTPASAERPRYKGHIHEEDAWAAGGAVGKEFRSEQAKKVAAEKAAKAAKKKAATKAAAAALAAPVEAPSATPVVADTDPLPVVADVASTPVASDPAPVADEPSSPSGNRRRARERSRPRRGARGTRDAAR